ncbi:hypothetical protein [Phenylobacterium sp.]|uniref:hypothetical protein n=1 Tax=Phenylobacterium sp. TaxID=1871053 RepID=UPI002B58CF90|nr:hypothetical protein [Phenylobacterium sp.]HLZ74576.1 hypothetical protein [Phenylobacterium sp.]
MERDLLTEEGQSAISWSAIIAGAATALAAAIVMLALGAGFGLKLGSPWPLAGASTDDFNPTLGAILVTIQVLSTALGGYLAGRLRTKWVNVHDHEVHFRDTAHGLLVWAVSTVAGVLLAVTVLAPAAGHVATQAVAAAAVQIEPVHAAGVAAQASLFMGIGLLLSGFTAAVAAGLGGLRRDEMHAAYWAARPRAAVPPL